MSRICAFLSALLLSPLAAAVATDAHSAAMEDPTSIKKGAAGQAKDVGKPLQVSGVSWLYNWLPEPGWTLPEGVEFVPMIWGKKNLPDIDKVIGRGKVLLAFNEPERKKQGNITVEEALEAWPKLEATQMRLGSPAPAAGGARPGGWLDRFMTGAKERGYRVDFVCVHWYGEKYDPDVATKDLKAYLSAVHQRYQKPIWLTEFALNNYKEGAAPATAAEQQAFMVKALPMLDALPFVERYSWFVFSSNRKDKPHNWYLLSAEGNLTEVGETYSDASPAK